MILESFLFIAGCMACAELLRAFHLNKVLVMLALPGIPVHELGHVLACLLFRVKIVEIDWVHLDWDEKRTEVGGHVRPNPARDAFTPIALGIAPLFTCWAAILLLVWVIPMLPSWNADPAWTYVLMWLAVSIAISAAPSGADLRHAASGARSHPGQFWIAIGGIVLGSTICWLLGMSWAEPWHLVVNVLVIFGPGWVLSRLLAGKHVS
jgi:hypothetical protein